MPATYIINAFLGSGLIIVLVAIDYIRMYTADRVLRGIFMRMLVYSFITLWAEILYYSVCGKPGQGVQLLLYATNGVYYFFHIFGLNTIFIFMDYAALKDFQRAKKNRRIILAITACHLIVLLLNVRYKFYFYITEQNYFARGNLYIIRSIFCCIPILFALHTMLFAKAALGKKQVSLFLLYFLIVGISSAVDALYGSTLLWPWFTVGLLFAYFFIISSDSKLDALTGLANRLAFNELMHKISRLDTGESYAIIMIDMDEFKQINDTLGHGEGDNALRDMGGIIKSCIRLSDFAARYGGDEFIIILKNEKDVDAVINRIMESVKTLNDSHTRPYTLQLSCGYDIFTANSEVSLQEILSHTDSLMYKNKELSRRSTDKVDTV